MSILSKNAVCLIDGVRTPFLKSFTGFRQATQYQLLRQILLKLMDETKVPVSAVNHICTGNVMQDVNTSNVAREAVIGAGFPLQTTAHTVSMACISSNMAITSCWEMIKSGNASAAIGSGVEIMSDPPIKYAKSLRQSISKLKPPSDIISFLNCLKTFANPKILTPELPGLVEFSTQETMGYSAERLAAKFLVTRREQDMYAINSHDKALKAQTSGLLSDVKETTIEYTSYLEDNGIRKTDYEKMRILHPVFQKPNGAITAGNSSFITDGASACLLMSSEKAREHKIKPKAILVDSVYSGCDPKDELLLGPAYAIAKILAKHKMTINDIDVFEIHEAFAGQILSVLKALDSVEFCKENLNLGQKIGMIPDEKLNAWGGSLALGHPLAATGVRLVTMACNRLKATNKRFGLVAACAAGAQANAMLIENYDAVAKSS